MREVWHKSEILKVHGVKCESNFLKIKPTDVVGTRGFVVIDYFKCPNCEKKIYKVSEVYKEEGLQCLCGLKIIPNQFGEWISELNEVDELLFEIKDKKIKGDDKQCE